MINFDAKKKIFNLSNDNYSYYFGINKLGYLIHLYSGKKLDEVGKNLMTLRLKELMKDILNAMLI